MKYVFYITNHGYGHASRNVPIILELLKRNSDNLVYVKSDIQRIEFLKRNFGKKDRIIYCDGYSETGLVLKEGTVVPDLLKMRKLILKDILDWDIFREEERKFLNEVEPDIVICDVTCWPIPIAKELGIKTLIIGNFTWAQMYESFYEKDIWMPYFRNYIQADKAIWYEIHDCELEKYCDDYECVSLVSRAVNYNNVRKIKDTFNKKIVFISLGASAEFEKKIDVSDLPYCFIITRGLNLYGENVFELPSEMINTPDYIAASDYVIAKGGWSTVAEILLLKKKCALVFRGENAEDNNTKAILGEKRQCVPLQGDDLQNIDIIIKKIDELEPEEYKDYTDDTVRICDIINDLIKKGENE